MKNILYIGPYKQHNGLGKSAKRFVDALSVSKDINLAIRPVYYSMSSYYDNFDNQYTEFEENTFKYYDIIIQHGLPDMFEYNRKFGKHIGIVEIETKNIKHSGWIERINLLDQVTVGSVFSANALLDSGVTTPVDIVPEPYDLIRYSAEYKQVFKHSGSKPFVFYTIGKYTDKKNIKNIILAYLLEFDTNDNVQLFIKTDDETEDHEHLKQLIEYDISQIKKCIRKHNKKTCDIDIVCGNISELDLIRIHQGGDCYINAVRSDGFGPCAIEAAFCNKIVINTKNIGSATYFNSTNALMVDADISTVFTPNYYNTNTFTIYEQWYEPDITSMRLAMRKAYSMNNDDKALLTDKFNKSVFDMNIIAEILL